ncbi:MAG: hypothetical protein HFJ12_04015 [Bacilli bacterium]|nr:hypothetical protein [Bacilli bacterium]
MILHYKKLNAMLNYYYKSKGLESQGKYDKNLIKWLCKDLDFKKVMVKRTLEKLSEEEFSYLVPTLENKVKFEDYLVCNQLLDKLEIIEANQIRGKKTHSLYPDIDSLWCGIGELKEGSILYSHIIKNLKDLNYTSAKRYYDITNVLLNSKNVFLNNMDFNKFSVRNITCFDQEHLKLFLGYDCDDELKAKSFSSLMNNGELMIQFNDFNSYHFNQVLDFLMKPSTFDSRIHIIKNLLEVGMYSPFLIDKIDKLPKCFIRYLGENENVDDSIRKDQQRFLEDMRKESNEAEAYYGQILHTSEEQYNNLLELVVNKDFCNFSIEVKSSILRGLTYLDFEKKEQDPVRYFMKSQFLVVGDSTTSGFLTKIDHSYFSSTLQFIQEEDKEVLASRFLVLSRLRKQIEDKSLSEELYSSYLESLENKISDMNSKDRIKYLDSHSRFFQKHSLEEFTKKINCSTSKDYIVDVLSENEKYKQAKCYYKLVDFIDYYDPLVAIRIIDQMCDCQGVHRRNLLFDIVRESSFINMDPKKQQEILDCYSSGIPLVFGSQDDVDMEVVIPDYKYVQSILENNPTNELIFENKDSKLKIKLKKNEE